MALRFSVDKNPGSYEPYQFTLSENYRKLAQDELGESDDNREQSLAQMREWIAKHPFIRKCRTDAVFLLRFLRFKKFSVPGAQESLERYLAVRQTYPEWFQKLDPRDELMQDAVDSEVFSAMGRDAAGRTVNLARYGLFDVEKHTTQSMFRYSMMFLEILLDDEEIQIGGFRVWVDFTDSLLKHYGMWGIPDMKLLVDTVNKTMPIRVREVQAAKLPKFAVTIANLLMPLAPAKLRERINCNRTVSESKQFFDESLWPKQYGGSVDTTERARLLKKQFEEKRDELLALDDMDIDIRNFTSLRDQTVGNSNCDIDGGIAGSFKKLNFD